MAEIERIFELSENEILQLYISESTLATTVYFLQKNKLDALTMFRELSTCLNFIPFKKQILFSPREKYKDLEDGLLYFSALHAGMAYFIIRNTKDFIFTLPNLPVMRPFTFFKRSYS